MFNIFISALDEGVGGDTELGGAANPPGAAQPFPRTSAGLRWLEELSEIQKRKCRVLPLRKDNPRGPGGK